MKRRVRGCTRTLALLVLAAVLVAAAAALTGCGRAEFQAGSAPDVQATIARAGLAVLDQGTAKNYYAGGDEARWYVVGKEGADQPVAVVSVLTFDSQQARDAAARDLDSGSRRGARVDGVYTVGNAVVRVNRITDRATVRELDRFMREDGMK
jgi:hypothetical protein